MKKCKKCGIEKEFSFFYVNKGLKDGYTNECKQCKSSRYKLNYNKEKSKEQWQSWSKLNKEKLKEYHVKYRNKNKEKIKQYFINNRDKSAIKTAKRRAALLQRTPYWLTAVDILEIESIYVYCNSLRKIGLKYEVDHIIPLQGKEVSGLHLPSNLRVIREEHNRKKSNKLEETTLQIVTLQDYIKSVSLNY